MNAPKRSRARVLTPEGLQKLRERVRSHEADHNNGVKYSLERLGELIGLDPETVKNVRDGKKADKSSIVRCFESFGLTLTESDHIPAAQATTTADPNFVGRDEAIADLDTLVSRNARVIVIQARGGVGKTTLARKYLQQEFGSFLEFPIAKETKDIASIEGLLEEKLRQLGEEPGREFLVSLDRLKRKLQAERIGILIDNLEPALDSAGKFIEAHRRYVELLRVLSDPIVQSLTLITSRERLREADVTVQHYPLRSLDVQAWSLFFQSRSINVDTPALATLHDAYGGNAKAMDIISGAVLEDFSGNVEAYWQANQDDLFIERDLEDLVTKQFDRLQQLDPDAYKLLCRMGCYRYQDVPMVPIEGLFCLLWDVPENRHRRVIKTLQDRSIVDFEDREFWLHPVIRAEAIVRLRKNEDWEKTNYKAAEFWTDSIQTIERIEQALKAFEAYHHYLEVDDPAQACDTIIRKRNNKWGKSEDLGEAFYRLGLLQPMILSINSIIGSLDVNESLGNIYSTLGDMYWLSGEIHKSIKSHKAARDIATSLKLKRLEIVSFLNLGLCNVDLWELEEAAESFRKINILAEKAKTDLTTQRVYVDDYEVDSWFCLAFVYSCLGMKEEARKFIVKTYENLSITEIHLWSRGYVFLFLGLSYKNLGEAEKSSEMHYRAIQFAEESYYIQLKARALSGLAEIYREKQKFELALLHHSQAIDFLNKIGAKCDLAEAYFQFGVTYQIMAEFDKSLLNFQEAIRLFSEMEAPKQVERVRRSMQNSL